MALARGILLWLPLDFLEKLRQEDPAGGLIGRELLLARLQIFNGLPADYLEPHTNWDSYAEVSTYHGEFSRLAGKYLPADALAARAAALQDVAWYRLFFLDSPGTGKGQLEALKSGRPEIQALLLTAYSLGECHLPFVFDPRGIKWSKGFARVLGQSIVEKGHKGRWQLAGFLLHPDQRSVDDAFNAGNIMYRALHGDPFSAKTAASLNSRGPGFYGCDRHPDRTAIAHMDLRAMQLLLQRGLPTLLLQEQPIVPDEISEYLCQQARGIYLLAQSDSRVTLQEPYLSTVKILAGLPLEILPQQRELLELMFRVAHPQTPALVRLYGIHPYYIYPGSEVQYDLPGLLEKNPELEVSDDLDNQGFIEDLYMRGQLLQVSRMPVVKKALRRNLQADSSRMIFSEAEFQTEYQRIYQGIMADQTPL